MLSIVNLFLSNALFLDPLKTSENLTFFWCFQGVEKGVLETNGLKCILVYDLLRLLIYFILSLYALNFTSRQQNQNFSFKFNISPWKYNRYLFIGIYWGRSSQSYVHKINSTANKFLISYILSYWQVRTLI